MILNKSVHDFFPDQSKIGKSWTNSWSIAFSTLHFISCLSYLVWLQSKLIPSLEPEYVAERATCLKCFYFFVEQDDPHPGAGVRGWAGCGLHPHQQGGLPPPSLDIPPHCHQGQPCTVGWSDFFTFLDFQNWAYCCRLDKFLELNFQKSWKNHRDLENLNFCKISNYLHFTSRAVLFNIF